MPRPLSRLSYANVVATLCLAVAIGGGIAVAQNSGGAPKPLYACAKKKGGAMRLVAKAKCKKKEKLVRWNQQGEQGPAGATGPAGPAGAPGANGATAGGGLPAGAIAFFDQAACPGGWSPYGPAVGRYVVGLPTSGAVAAQVGTPLGDQENRPAGKHNHTITDPGHTHDAGARTTIRAGNVPFGSFQANGGAPLAGGILTTLSRTTGITVDDSAGASGVTGTNAPYVQLLACRKD